MFDEDNTGPMNLHSFLPTVGALALVASLSSCAMTNKGQARLYQKAELSAPYDAVVVPGVPFEGGQWQDIMKMRVHWAVKLYERGLTRNIIFSGSAVYTPYVEATIMGLYAEQLGVPRENIFLETRAEHSTENLFNSYMLARDRGMKRIALASDPFQSWMLRGLAKRMERQLGADIDMLPVVFKDLFSGSLSTPAIDPAPAYVQEFVSLPERENFFKRFLGTSGNNLDWDRARADAARNGDRVELMD